MSPLRFIASIAAIVAACLTGGCVPTPSPPETQQLSNSATPICRIAVLPFINHTGYLQGDLIFYRIFIAELNRRGDFTVAQEGDVREIFRQMKLSPKDIPGHEQLLILADRLAIDAVISGEIVTMHEEQGAKETQPQLAVALQLTPVGSAKPLLATYHRRSGEDYRKVLHFGLINTMTSLAALVADEILTVWKEKGLTPCAW